MNEEKVDISQQVKKEEKESKSLKIKIFSSEWYDKNYKLLFFISLSFLFFSLFVLGFNYFTKGELIKRDVSLTGGTIITVYTSEPFDVESISRFLQEKLKEPVVVRKLQDITTGKQIGIFLESRADSEKLKEAIEEYLKIELTEENSTIETISSGLSKSFFKELLTALLLAFLFMAIAVVILFKKAIPCLAVILAALTDIFGALALASLFNLSISTAGIAALLMLVGYSVDTDIMLTTKVLKRREEPLNSRIKSAFRTGVMMTSTSLIAVLMAYFIVNSDVLKQIFFILAAGLFVDLIATWLGNASILKWYCEKKKIS